MTTDPKTDSLAPTGCAPVTGSEVVEIPKAEWRKLMGELRDFRSDHAAMQSRLANILGELSSYAAVPNPINHSEDLHLQNDQMSQPEGARKL